MKALECYKSKNQRHATYWQAQAYPVMLVIRTSDGIIRWMDVSTYLREQSKKADKSTTVKQVIFQGELFNAVNLLRLRDRLLEQPLGEE